MAFQSPLIAIPKKATSDVDWATPIRAIIANSYGESPSAYVEECSVLQRCRQDAVKGAGSDATGELVASDPLAMTSAYRLALQLEIYCTNTSVSWSYWSCGSPRSKSLLLGRSFRHHMKAFVESGSGTMLSP